MGWAITEEEVDPADVGTYAFTGSILRIDIDSLLEAAGNDSSFPEVDPASKRA